MTNSEMKPNRFLNLCKYKKLYSGICEAIKNGFSIQVTTYTQSRIYKSIDQFKIDKLGVYAQRGKHWDNITLCSIRSFKNKS